MVRTFLVPENTHIELDIPKEFVGKEIEVFFSPVEEEIIGTKSKKTMRDFLGILSKESANELRSEVRKSRDEWERDI